LAFCLLIFALDQLGQLSDNAALYFKRLGITPLSTSRSKNPFVYFPVNYLADLLDLDSVWESEFSHLFAREVAMTDSSLLSELLSIAKTPGAARRAFAFYGSVRAYGYAAARASVGKSQFYAHRRLLGLAGVSDPMLQDGAPLIRHAPSACHVRAFTPARDRLDLVERAHSLVMPSVIDRLHSEVFSRVA